MDRKQFLFTIWKWFFIPTIIVIISYFCISFLIEAMSENSFERFVIIGTLGFVVLMGIARVLGNIFKKTKDVLYSKLSDNTKRHLRIVEKIIDYIAVLSLGGMLYVLWTKDKFLGCLFVLILIIDKIRQILREEKTKTTVINIK